LRSQEQEDQLRIWKHFFDFIDFGYRMFSADEEGAGLTGFANMARRYTGRLVDSIQNGKPIIWHNLGFNPELFLAFEGLYNLCVEQMGAFYIMAYNTQAAMDMIDLSEAEGVPSDMCSADKISIGAMTMKHYPRPICHLAINSPCDSQVVATQAMLELEPAPIFVVDVPYYSDDRAVKYVADQLFEMSEFIARHTGIKMDWDRMRHVCEISNQTVETLWDWMEWRKHVPVVQPSKLCSLITPLQMVCCGTEEGLDFARGLLKEARAKAERGRAVVEERVRAIWYQDPVWFDLQLYDWMEKVLGLTVPMDLFGYYANEGLIDTSTPESMLFGLANKMIRIMPMTRQFRGDAETFISDFMRIHDAYQADCGIFAGHLGCKHGWAVIGLFKEACRKANIPLLIFPYDMMDPRVTSKEDIKHELTRFVNEIVLPRKS
jgi:benzoyl-CoA reductase subunit B